MNKAYKFYIVYEYIENFINRYGMSERDFCEKCDINIGVFKQIQNPNYSLVKLIDVMKISYFIKVPISKLVIHLENWN